MCAIHRRRIRKKAASTAESHQRSQSGTEYPRGERRPLNMRSKRNPQDGATNTGSSRIEARKYHPSKEAWRTSCGTSAPTPARRNAGCTRTRLLEPGTPWSSWSARAYGWVVKGTLHDPQRWTQPCAGRCGTSHGGQALSLGCHESATTPRTPERKPDNSREPEGNFPGLAEHGSPNPTSRPDSAPPTL